MRKKEKPIIELKDVWKIYQMGKVEVPALRGLNLTVYPHEFISVMGPSGSGKSTAMNMIGCLDLPTRGEIFLESQDISHLEESELAQIRGRKIGFIFQTFNLMPGLTAIENVMLPMIFQNVPFEERYKIAKKVLESVGLGHRLNHTPGELSGGERQRVAVARSLVNDPQVVLADEPTGNLDSKTSMEVMKMLFDLHEKEGKTIILVTHDKNVAKFADKIYHLTDGKIIEKGGKKK